MDILVSLIVIIVTFSTFYFPVKIYLNLLKYKEVALGLIFTHLEASILSFKIYAVTMLIFALSRLLDLLNTAFPSPFYDYIDDLLIALYLVVNVLLIYAFYKLSVIVRIDKETI